MVSMEHTQVTHLTFGCGRRGTHNFSTQVWLVALTHVCVGHSLTTQLTRMFLCRLGKDLAWCHRDEHQQLVIPFEGVLVRATIM